jgi:hypothetical protein
MGSPFLFLPKIQKRNSATNTGPAGHPSSTFRQGRRTTTATLLPASLPCYSALDATELQKTMPLDSSSISPIKRCHPRFISTVTGAFKSGSFKPHCHQPFSASGRLTSRPSLIRQPPPSVKAPAPLVHLLPFYIAPAPSPLRAEAPLPSCRLLITDQAPVRTKTESP